MSCDLVTIFLSNWSNVGVRRTVVSKVMFLYVWNIIDDMNEVAAKISC